MDIEKNENILNRVQEWIKSADQKVSIFLAFQSLLITIFLPIFSLENFYKILNCKFETLITIFSVAGIIFLVLSIFKSISAIIPRIGKKVPRSLTYFGSIADMELSDYKKLSKNTDNKEYNDELLTQIHISSKIAKKKHVLFREAIIFFSIGFMVFMSSILFINLYGY